MFKDLRDTFDSIDRALLERWVADRQEEHVSLDFKVLARTSFSNDDKRNLARAISGFANSQGGLLIWGIDARRDEETGVDGAKSFNIIPNVRQALSRANELIGEATTPSVSDTLNRVIMFSDSDGCLITLVPESFTGPHMAKLGDGRYYKRSGDSFYQMEHFDLSDMFGRRQRPELEVVFEREMSGSPDLIRLKIAIRNSGRASAHNAGFYIGLSNIAKIESVSHGIKDASDINHGTPSLSLSLDAKVIHPVDILSYVGTVVLSGHDNKSIKIDGFLYCDQMQTKTLDYEFILEPYLG